MRNKFQSTLPAWGATKSQLVNIRLTVFQSTLPAWGATFCKYFLGFCVCISIHAPRMGSDVRDVQLFLKRLNFNPRSPHGERQYSQSIQQ